MINIKKFTHKITLGDGQIIEVNIQCENGYWQSEPVQKPSLSGAGSMSGGKYDSLEEYIKKVELQHRYSYNFFNKGYQYARAHL